MRKPSHTPTSLQTHACRLISLHTGPTTLGHNHTPTFWRAASFTRRYSYTRTLLHTNPNTHTHKHTHTHAHTHTRTHTHTHIDAFTWDPFTRSCTHQHFHTQSLHTKVFFISCTHHWPIHTHIDIIPEASSLQWPMIYIFSFSFLRNQFSAKILFLFIAKPNFVQCIWILMK